MAANTASSQAPSAAGLELPEMSLPAPAQGEPFLIKAKMGAAFITGVLVGFILSGLFN